MRKFVFNSIIKGPWGKHLLKVFQKFREQSKSFADWEDKCVAYGRELKLKGKVKEYYGRGQNLCYELFWYWVNKGVLKW